jgi:hypothetical protein
MLNVARTSHNNMEPKFINAISPAIMNEFR